MPRPPKDGWDKAAIFLAPVGGLLTAFAVAWIGSSLNDRQADDTNMRLYAELMGRREEADTNLRKDMFNTAFKAFVESKPVSLEKELLNLELLAYNFHESIDLGPIFKDVYARILDPDTPITQKERAAYRDRVERVARKVIDKQMSALEVDGKLDADIFFSDLKPEGSVVLEDDLPGPTAEHERPLSPRRHFVVRVLRVNADKRELRIQLRATRPINRSTRDVLTQEPEAVQSTFWVSFADFPMIDNSRLSEGYRCAVVLREFNDLGARVTLVYFPTSRAALKDKPYYGEMMGDLLRARRNASEQGDSGP